jgi:hypothetical protein
MTLTLESNIGQSTIGVGKQILQALPNPHREGSTIIVASYGYGSYKICQTPKDGWLEIS